MICRMINMTEVEHEPGDENGRYSVAISMSDNVRS